MLLFCPVHRPGAGCGIPTQWGPYNWEPCLLFSPPLLPHLFIFLPLISSLVPSLNMWTVFFKESTSKTESERVNLLLLSPTLSPPVATVDLPCTADIYPECFIAQAFLPSIHIRPCVVSASALHIKQTTEFLGAHFPMTYCAI